MTEEKTDISLEERLAKRLAARLPNYDDGRADTAVVRDALECALKDAQPIGRVIAEEDEEDEEDDETLAELEHMRDVADMAYAALSDLALHCHDRREDVAWCIARRAAEDAHGLATFVGDWIEDMEDED